MNKELSKIIEAVVIIIEEKCIGCFADRYPEFTTFLLQKIATSLRFRDRYDFGEYYNEVMAAVWPNDSSHSLRDQDGFRPNCLELGDFLKDLLFIAYFKKDIDEINRKKEEEIRKLFQDFSK